VATGEKGSPRVSRIEVAKRTELRFELDDEKIEAIKRCLETGQLSITVTDVDLSQGGRLEAAYIYD
jgi:hypothetical protein